jgi:hypothetical protein
VWIDYGRGYVSTHPRTSNALFIAFAWAYVAVQALYVAAWSGAMPWPAGWSILAEWLELAGSFMYAATSLLYSRETGDAGRGFYIRVRRVATE